MKGLVMNVILLGARLLLAGVLSVAGVAKLADRAGSRQALQDFGIPARLAPALGLLLPLAELAMAGALVSTTTAWVGALGALLLLLLFCAGISRTLVQGRTPPCHCFGQLSSTPVGWATLVRTGVLAAIAAGVVWHGPQQVGPSAVRWLGDLPTTQLAGMAVSVVVLGLLAAQGWLLLHLLRQQGRLLLRLDALEARMAAGGLAPRPVASPSLPGLAIGAPALAFRLAGLYGETLTLEALRAPGKPVVLIFADPDCGPCTALLPALARWQREHAAQLTLALISRGTVEANQTKTAVHGVTHVLLQQDREVAEAYQAVGTPTAVLVRPDGTIGSPLVPGTQAIEALVAHAVTLPAAVPVPLALPAPIVAANGRCPHCGHAHSHDHNGTGAAPASSQPPAVSIGQPALALHLPDLHGKPIALTAFRGRPTLLLFWNPGCGFCAQMLADLKAWEAHPPPGAPQLLVVSTGTAEANHAMGLRSPVVLDEAFTAGRAFGATGTPSAVLIDAQGHIASTVAVGAQAVLTLAAGSDASPHPPSRPAWLAQHAIGERNGALVR
jgi:peroxiredoxin